MQPARTLSSGKVESSFPSYPQSFRYIRAEATWEPHASMGCKQLGWSTIRDVQVGQGANTHSIQHRRMGKSLPVSRTNSSILRIPTELGFSHIFPSSSTIRPNLFIPSAPGTPSSACSSSPADSHSRLLAFRTPLQVSLPVLECWRVVFAARLGYGAWLTFQAAH